LEQDVKQFHTMSDMQVDTRKNGWGGRLKESSSLPVATHYSKGYVFTFPILIHW